VKPAKDIAQDVFLWTIIVAIILLLVGCSDLRRLTMTKDELRLYGQLEIRQCISPDVVCIVEN